ncbi:hypothetical protein VPNG_06019 [Cytospora leucostoma]|uniref:Uncharacterized protein n=1 Tax=Cytospora leucostoma TaxID=1230097 RepID=A0A423XAZ0_9PEZI|nr:hypothetical protein VPNG_06019 [Cytospora leucostoma]
MEPTQELPLSSGGTALDDFDHHTIFEQLINVEKTHQLIHEATGREIQRAPDGDLSTTGPRADVEPARAQPHGPIATDQFSKLTTGLSKLEEVRLALRKAFSARARPLIRNLNIMDLPDELLRQIFALVRSTPTVDNRYYYHWDSFYSDYEKHSSDFKSIENARLSCRRFCDTSSHLLLNRIDVHLNLSSLAHLDEVSRHPTISKGIRSLRVIAKYYGSAIADDISLFASKCIPLFRSRQSIWYPRVDFDSKEQAVQLMDKARDFAAAWASFVDTHQEPTDEKGRLAMEALRQGHARYRQLHREQEHLVEDGALFQAISAAAARMPKMDRLLITDDDYMYPPLRKREQIHAWKEMLDTPGLWVTEETVVPAIWQDEQLGNGHPPTSLLYELPFAFHRAGTSLTHFKIKLSPPLRFHLDLDKEQNSELKSAMGNLRDFSLMCYHTCPRRDLQDTTNAMDFLAICMDSQKAERLHCSFSGIGKDRDDWEVIVSTLSRLRWSSPGLRYLSLCELDIHLHELLKVIDRLKPKITLHLYRIDLLSGTWTEALDAIRLKCAGNLDSRISRISGVDIRFLAREVWTYEEWEDMIDLPYDDYDIDQANEVTRYITGLRPDNPLRAGGSKVTTE